MKGYIKLILLLLIACQNKKSATHAENNASDTISNREAKQSVNINTISQDFQPEEYLVDSLNIGRKSLNKVELSKYRTPDSNYVVIKFYSMQSGKWVLKNDIQSSKDGITDCDPQITDFNNDGLNDLTFKSAVAARGANEVRRLFIYDSPNDRLLYLKNSEAYPNMIYNKKLDCIDAFLVYGGCSTVF